MARLRTHTRTIPITISALDDEIEIIAEIEYTVIPGTPEIGPSYASGGEPATPPEVDIMDIVLITTSGGNPAKECREEPPVWLTIWLGASDAIYQELGEAVNWGAVERDPDDARDRVRDDAMMGRK